MSNKALKIAKRYQQAGWSAIDCQGNMVRPPVDKGRLQNAIPGVDPSDGQLYMGDGPLDVMGDALKKVDLLYRDAWNRPASIEEITALLKSEIKTEHSLHQDGYIHNAWIDAVTKATGLNQRQVLVLPQEKQDHLMQVWRDYDYYLKTVNEPETFGYATSNLEPDIQTWKQFMNEAEWTVAPELDRAALLLNEKGGYFKAISTATMIHLKDELDRKTKIAKAHFRKHGGWWAIKSPESPGLSPPPGYSGNGLMNAIPGTHGADQSLYNGDGPADVMDDALSDIDLLYRASWGRPATYDELLAVFNFCSRRIKDGDKIENDWLEQLGILTHIDIKKIAQLPEDLREHIRQAYRFYIQGCYSDGPCNEIRHKPTREGVLALKAVANDLLERYRSGGFDY